MHFNKFWNKSVKKHLKEFEEHAPEAMKRTWKVNFQKHIKKRIQNTKSTGEILKENKIEGSITKWLWRVVNKIFYTTEEMLAKYIFNEDKSYKEEFKKKCYINGNFEECILSKFSMTLVECWDDPCRGPTHYNIQAWVHTVLKYKVREFKRKERRHDIPEIEFPDKITDRYTNNFRIKRLLHYALEFLEEEEKLILHLRFYERLTFNEIKDKYRLTRYLYNKAITNLRRLIDDLDGFFDEENNFTDEEDDFLDEENET